MTVRMIKDYVYADIADNPESIRLAQLEGWSLVDDVKSDASDTINESSEQTSESVDEDKEVRKGRGRPAK